MNDVVAEFDAWFAAQPPKPNPVPGYEQAAFMRWAMSAARTAPSAPAFDMPPVASAVVETAPVVAAADDPKTSVGSFGPPAAPPPPAPPPPAPLLPVVAFTDGSGTVAHLPSGAGVVVFEGDEIILEASRRLGPGTNNHAELSAVRVALFITATPGLVERPLLIRTDSMYVIGALTSPWAVDPWRPNAKLITIIREAMTGRAVTFEHVKGHSGVAGNERADELAGLARLRAPAVKAVAA